MCRKNNTNMLIIESLQYSCSEFLQAQSQHWLTTILFDKTQVSVNLEDDLTGRAPHCKHHHKSFSILFLQFIFHAFYLRVLLLYML